MRERLIQLIKQAHTDYLLNDDYAVSIYEFIADRLIKNGAILPFVKVGQTVHILPKHDKVIILTAVEWILQDRDEIVYYTGDYEFYNTDIGKTVFTTREAAEAAFKARENSAD